MSYHLKNYGLLATLQKSFELFGKHFVFFLIISLISSIPLAVFTYFNPNQLMKYYEPNLSMDLLINQLGFLFIEILTTALISRVVIQTIYQKLKDNKISYENILKNSLPNLAGFLFLTFLCFIISILGTFVFVVPGIMALCMLSVSGVAFIIEKKPVFESMKRSFNLTEGKRLFIFGLFLLVTILLFSVIIFIYLMQTDFSVSESIKNWTLFLITIISEPLIACLTVVLYFNLRVEKEELTQEQL